MINFIPIKEGQIGKVWYMNVHYVWWNKKILNQQVYALWLKFDNWDFQIGLQ